MQEIPSYHFEKTLERLKLPIERKEPTLQFLNEIFDHVSEEIPFENLDILKKKKIEIDLNKIYSKLVGQKRGGLCYEVHTLMYQVLKDLGFEVHYIQGQVWKPNLDAYTIKFAHIILMIKIDNRNYVFDAGFGNFYTKPFLLENTEYQDFTGFYKVENVENTDQWIVHCKRKKEQDYIPLYKLDTEIRGLQDFYQANDDQFNDPNWFFYTLTLLIKTIDGNQGRIIMTQKGMSILHTDPSKQANIDFGGDKQQLIKYMKEYFNYGEDLL